MFRKILLSTIAAATLAGAGAGVYAATTIYATVAPPAPRSEAVPAPRRGKEWVAGHYEWRGGQYVWTRGYWVQARKGHRYESAHWVERDGRWYMERGRWARGDRDGDGVPNRVDRNPNNPNRS